METNYIDVDLTSSHWISLEMIKSYIEQRPLDRENILLHINNTIKNGYILSKEFELNELKSELDYYKRAYNKSLL